ncbi:MAG: hypothetical protein AMJ81_12425, partial [Phycisphaerae bacterium SM23_33]
LIEYLLERCEPPARQAVQDRLAQDQAFGALHDDLRHTFQALDLLPAAEPPEDLAADTMARIRREREEQRAAAEQEIRGGVHRPVFSLRELGAIAAAAILLAFVFVPSMRRARHQALRVYCRANVGGIGTAIRSYANAGDGYLPSVISLNRRWLPGQDQPAVSNSVGLFKLVKQGFAAPGTFQCPGVASAEEAGFELEPDMDDFPSGRFIHYSYQHTLGPSALSRLDRELIAVAASMAILADHTPVFRDGRFLRNRVRALASDNHDATGQNVLYFDMHVEWKEQAGAGVQGNNIYLAEGIFEYRGDETPVNVTDSFLLPAFAGKDLSSQP